jgi:2-polyprenyl-3-methyl-5-hydroxy-6-metoxy-1,4-benzoquinol methylase
MVSLQSKCYRSARTAGCTESKPGIEQFQNESHVVRQLAIKGRYFLRSLRFLLSGDRHRCPNCGAESAAVISRKYIVTALRRCPNCELLFRTPTDEARFAESFYNEEYEEGFTTTMPSAAELAELKVRAFQGSDRDYGHHLSVLRQIGLSTGARIFEYGCSWGYGAYQLDKRGGYAVTAYDISRSRGGYARANLGVSVLPDLRSETLAEHFGAYDCFFSSHVLEHVGAVSTVIAFARTLLKPGGIFVAVTPNGSDECRRALPQWDSHWGEVHPNFLNAQFYLKAFAGQDLLLDGVPSNPELLRAFAVEKGQGILVGDLTSPELLCVTRMGSS